MIEEIGIRDLGVIGEARLPLGSGFVPAVVCKEFVFVAGQMAAGEAAIDPSVMIPPRRNWGGASPIRRQAEFVIRKRLEPALVAAGSSLANAVKAQIYVDQAKHVPDVLDVWAKCFGDTPCAITIVPTKGYAEVDGLIEINLLALRDGARRKKEVDLTEAYERAAHHIVPKSFFPYFAAFFVALCGFMAFILFMAGKVFGGLLFSFVVLVGLYVAWNNIRSPRDPSGSI